jgi:hypothetical protein
MGDVHACTYTDFHVLVVPRPIPQGFIIKYNKILREGEAHEYNALLVLHSPCTLICTWYLIHMIVPMVLQMRQDTQRVIAHHACFKSPGLS